MVFSPFYGTPATYDTTDGSPTLSYMYMGEEYTIIFSKHILRSGWGWVSNDLKEHYERICDSDNDCTIVNSRDFSGNAKLSALATITTDYTVEFFDTAKFLQGLD